MASDGQQRVGALVSIRDLLDEMGADRPAVLSDAGLPPDALDDEESTISFVAAGRLLKACVKRTNCDHFALLAGRRFRLSDAGIVGQMMRSAPTLGTALFDFIGNHHRDARGAVPYLLAFGDTLVFGYTIY